MPASTGSYFLDLRILAIKLKDARERMHVESGWLASDTSRLSAQIEELQALEAQWASKTSPDAMIAFIDSMGY
jgi:hypothetical protein